MSADGVFVKRGPHLVDGDVADQIRLVYGVCQEQEISTVKGRFHRSTAGDTSVGIVAHANNLTNLRTTTIGLSVFVTNPRPFHIMRPDTITLQKLSACRKACEVENPFLLALLDVLWNIL